jgi:hypothetical protein
MKFSFKKVLEPYLQLSKVEFQWLFYLHAYSKAEKYVIVVNPLVIKNFQERCAEAGVVYSYSHARNSFYKLISAGFLEKAPAPKTYILNQKYFSYD